MTSVQYRGLVCQERPCSRWHAIRLLDGGTGEELLSARGVPDDRQTWSAKAVSDPVYHDTLRLVHVDFLKSGSEYITVNNFGITPGVFGEDQELIKKLTRLAGTIARQAASSTTPPGRVLASLPPLVESYRPDLALKDHARAVSQYRSLVIETLDDLVDGWIAETLSSSAEVIDAMDAVWSHVHSTAPSGSPGGSSRNQHQYQETQRELLVSMCVKDGGLVRSGEKASEAVRRIVEHWVARPGLRRGQSVIRLSAVLFNCSTPEDIAAAFEELHTDTSLLALLDEHGIQLGCYPNRLTKIPDDWTLESSTEPQATRKDMDEDQFVAWTMGMLQKYTRVGFVGGCCGIGPRHISALSRALSTERRV